MMRSLRVRLLVSTSIAAAVVLALLGASIYAAMRHVLLRDFDASMQADARLLAGMVRQKDGGKLDFDFERDQMPNYLSEKQGRFFEVTQDDGKVLARSPSLRDNSLPKPKLISGVVVDIELPGDRDGRLLTMSYPAQLEERDEKRSRSPVRIVAVTVAAAPTQAYHTLNSLGWLLTSLGASAVLIMGAVLWRVVGQGLFPVKRLAGEIDLLNETDLAHRFPAEGVPNELAPVVEKLNGLLSRLDGAFMREKSFTADVAHELRTPLTGLRMTLEVCRSQPRGVQAYEVALDDCRAITDRMEAMVESLLMLARSDAGIAIADNQSVDVSSLIMECWNPLQYRVSPLEISTAISLADDCVIETDPAKLRIVLQNVLDNAVSYVNSGGRISISLQSNERDIAIRVMNTGSLIESGDTQKVFERFWRGDLSRTDAGAHCGLGLSLSQRLMTLLRGEIRLESVKGGEFSVQLILPRVIQLGVPQI